MTKSIDNKDITMESAILSTAEEVFLEKGFALTTTTEIARRVGCNQALVHYYFRTKELLFQQVFAEKVKLFHGMFFEIDKRGGSFTERIARKVEAHFDVLMENPRLPFLILNEITTNPERIKNMGETLGTLPMTMIQTLREDFEAEVAQGNVRDISIFDFVLNLISINVSTFMVIPLLKNGMGMSQQAIDQFVANRKSENVKTILNSIKP